MQASIKRVPLYWFITGGIKAVTHVSNVGKSDKIAGTIEYIGERIKRD